MMNIALDEGYVFDMLAILGVKLSLCNEESKATNSSKYEDLKRQIIQNIGIKKFEKIIQSKEYSRLLAINRKVFGLIELAKNDNGLAKITDRTNYKRYVLKSALQKKFFCSNPTEIKMGYKN